MNKIALSLALVLTPAALVAQTSAGAQSQTRVDGQVKSGPVQASSATTVDAEIAVARQRRLPTEPIRRRAAEARAKGRTEVQAAMAAGRMRANLESTQEAFVRAGRPEPRQDEIEHGAYAMERGYTSAQVEAVARSAPSDRSLVVAFDVLSRLSAQGVASAQAVAQVQSRLLARQPDAQISALASSNVNAGAGAARGASVGAATSGAASVGKGAASATGAATGAVGAVIRKP